MKQEPRDLPVASVEAGSSDPVSQHGAGGGAYGLSASVRYDQSTKLIIMGCLCHMDDVVNVGKVELVANEIMAVMSRRRKPSKTWGVTVSITPNGAET